MGQNNYNNQNLITDFKESYSILVPSRMRPGKNPKVGTLLKKFYFKKLQGKYLGIFSRTRPGRDENRTL